MAVVWPPEVRMNYATQLGASFIAIGSDGLRTSGVFLYPERIQIVVLRVDCQVEEREGEERNGTEAVREV